MAILTTVQKKKLDTLVQAKAFYDAETAKIKQELEIRKNANKQVVIELINECIAAGVPVRQIHMTGMGMGQANQMTNFMTPRVGTMREQLLALLDDAKDTSEAAPFPGVVAEPTVEFKGKTVEWTRRDGTKHTGTVQGQAWGVVYTLDNLTDEDKEILDSTDNKRVLFGDAEIEAYEDGTHPAHWAGKNIPVNKYA